MGRPVPDFVGRSPAGGGRATDEQTVIASVRELYEREYLRLVRLATFLVGSADRAEEIVQDAFVDLVVAWWNLRDQGAAGGYLRTCVVNGSRSHLRHRMVVERQPAVRLTDVESAEKEAMVQLEHERILATLSRLPGRQREVLVLRYYGQLSESEIADTLGISRGSVKSHTARGLRALRSVMEVDR